MLQCVVRRSHRFRGPPTRRNNNGDHDGNNDNRRSRRLLYIVTILHCFKPTTVTYHRRRTTDSRRDEFYARRSGTTRRHCRHNADASTPSPTTLSSHLPRPETVGSTRAPCTCRCAGESRRARSGTTDDRRATLL